MEKIQFRITDVTLNDFGLECFKARLIEKPLILFESGALSRLCQGEANSESRRLFIVQILLHRTFGKAFRIFFNPFNHMADPSPT